MRGSLYKLASILGWVNAIAKGDIFKRIIRVFAFKKLMWIIRSIR